MEWDENRREFVRRDREWHRYSDPRGDDRPFESRREGSDARGRDRDYETREPGMRERPREWGERARSMMDRDRDRDDHRGVFAPRVSYEDWRESSNNRGPGFRGVGEDWRQEHDRDWRAEPTRYPDTARRWSTRDDDRHEGWFARDRDAGRDWGREDRMLGRSDRNWDAGDWRRDVGDRNTRYGTWGREDRRELRGSAGHDDGRSLYGDLADIPRWNGRDFAPRHDEYRSDWRDDRRDWDRDDRHEDRGLLARMKEKFTGRAPRNYRRSDDRIREDLCDRLMQSWIDADDVDVQVKDGEVTLTGNVRTRSEKRGIEDLAEGVLGVKDVNNHVKVRRDVDERPRASSDLSMTTGSNLGSSMGATGAGATTGAGGGTAATGGTARSDGRAGTGVGGQTGASAAPPANGTHSRS